MKKLRFTVLALVVILAVFSAVTAAAKEPKPGIRLAGYDFSPASGQSANTPPGLTISGYAQNQQGYYIVQFSGPVEQAWKDSVEAAGAEFLGYIPDFAFKVRMNPAQAAQVETLADVAWVGLYQPAFKLSPELGANTNGLYRIRIERGAALGQTRAAVAQTGAEVITMDGSYLLVAANGAQLVDIANVVDVAWVENFLFAETHNEQGGGVIMGSNTANANGYDGSTQTVAVADTGLGTGSPSGAHVDIPASRITGIFNWTTGNAARCYRVYGDGAQDVDSGHGTHTAVSAVGDGGVGGLGTGVAPAANLIFQAVEDYLDIYGACTNPNTPDGYYLIGLPDDLHALYQQAYDNGARIHSNSWGSAQAGVYTVDSANTDDFIWDNPNMTITFSAGNEGVDANANGVVDDDSIGSPATAKNVVTVGASEGERPDNFPCDTGLGYTSHDAYQPGQTCTSMGGRNILGTAGARWGFPTAPLLNDITGGNANQMAPFSSRGPTNDGRIKPDVVAPGTWILSGYSSLYQEGYGDPVNPQNGLYQWDGWGMPYNQDYKWMGGTSMSNPLVAGGAAVVRDFYEKAYGHSASAALVKATLINSAVDLLDENNDGANDNDYPIPNVHEGWGRVDLANATDGTAQYMDNAGGIGTNGTATYPFAVDSAGSAFKVTLVWSDFPSTEAASSNLVNDLDLTVTAPNGTTVYRGNVFSGGWSQTGGSRDGVNNVENVYVQSAAAGTWTVEVSGYNVPNGPQPFALVVDGNLGAPNSVPVVTISSPSDGATFESGQTIAFSGTASDTEDGSLTAVLVWTSDLDGQIGTGGSFSASLSDGTHVITATATDSGGVEGSDSITVTVGSGGQLVVTVTTDKPSYSNRQTVNITTHVTDGTNPVEGAAVTVTITTASGNTLSGSGTTDANGNVVVTYKVNSKRDGTGIYQVNATATKATYTAGSGSTTFTVQ